MTKLGVVYPQVELGGSPDAARRLAVAVEELGFDHLLAYDHVLGGTAEKVGADAPYQLEHPFHDPFVFFAHVAALTTSIELVTGVLVLPQRQTALVARQAADLDLLSGGRLRLGVGTGWNAAEYQALGIDFTSRGRRLDEQIGLLRRLWSSAPVTHDGEFDELDRVGINPRPNRRIPIWVGGSGPRVMQRAAASADGMILTARQDPYDQLVELRRHLEASDRDPSELGTEILIHGRPEKAASRIERWFEAGGTHAAVVTMHLGHTTADQHIDHLSAVRTRLEAVA